MKCFVLILIMVIFSKAYSKDFGNFGATFPIQEKSLMKVIQSKLSVLSESGQLSAHQQKITREAQEKIRRPRAITGIRKTTEARTFIFDPSITVPYDLKDHNGIVFQKKGTRVNPLDTLSLRCPLLFLDGDDSDQIIWAFDVWKKAAEEAKPKLILVNGSPFELSEKYDLPVYFDQSGVLTQKLGITQVPARVSQQDKRLLVEEMKTKNSEEKSR